MKARVLRNNKAHKPIYDYIEIEPIQNTDRLFYYVTSWERDGDHFIDVVYKIEELYVFGYAGSIKDLDKPKNINFIESWRSSFLSSINESKCPSLLEIRVYQELGLDYEPLIERRKKSLLEDSIKHMNVENSFISGETISGCDFVRLCFHKGIKIPQDVLEIAGWQTAYIDEHSVAFKKGVDTDLQRSTVQYIIQIRYKLINSRKKNAFIKSEDVLGNPVYWINGYSFDMVDEGDRACGVFINPDYKNKDEASYGKRFVCEVRSRNYRTGLYKDYFGSLKEAQAWGSKEYAHMVCIDGDNDV